MAVKFLGKEQTINEIKNNKETILTFYADWCGACKMIAPILDELSNDFNVIKINIDDEKEYAIEMGVKSIPTTFIYKNGKLKETIVGFVTKEDLINKIK